MKYMNILHMKQISAQARYLLGLSILLLFCSACSWDSPYENPNSPKSPVIIGSSPTSSAGQNVPPLDNTTQQQVIQHAIQQIGLPYQYGGNNPKGFDCSGLVQYSFARSGIIVPRTTSEQIKYFTEIPRSQLKAGDLVFFKIDNRQRHVAIMLNAHDFVHAPSSGKNVSTSNLSNPYWKPKFLKAARYY